MKYALIAIAFIYFIFPRDLIPDGMGILGRVDDLIVALYCYYQYQKYLKRKMSTGAYSENKQETKSDSGQQETTQAKAFDPYNVLRVSRDSSSEEISKSYKNLMKQYHPDNVQHLGEELREVAHEKSVEIQKAYEMLKS